MGALLVLSMTIGYVTADRLLAARAAGGDTAPTRDAQAGAERDTR